MVGRWPVLALAVSMRASSSAMRDCTTAGCWSIARLTQASTSCGLGRGSTIGCARGRGFTPAWPTSWSSARRFTRRSFSVAISCAVAKSNRACASRLSVMVALPTSKLRWAEASCSATEAFSARTKASDSSAASTSKYACDRRTIRSCSVPWSCTCASSALFLPWSHVMRLAGRNSGCEPTTEPFSALNDTLPPMPPTLVSAQLRCAPSCSPTCGSKPARAWSARAWLACALARADW